MLLTRHGGGCHARVQSGRQPRKVYMVGYHSLSRWGFRWGLKPADATLDKLDPFPKMNPNEDSLEFVATVVVSSYANATQEIYENFDFIVKLVRAGGSEITLV